MANIALYLLVATCLAAGQFLFKRAGRAIAGQKLVDGLTTLALLPTFYLALAIYGFATVMWIYVLSRASLSEAYPWIAAGGMVVPLIGWYAYGERVQPIFWVGMAMILLGVLLTQLGTQR